ncbi:MAG: serine/threonine protein kinase, partial [Phycisphaerales bacterium]|nr:serine/threonine protein kinase [Phycisphaerales bacterium]
MSERELIEGALNQVDRAQVDPALPDRHLFPGYEILCEIHRGGQGVVYQALQIATKRRVAVKVLHEGPFAGSTGRARFDREIQILGQLHHPSIVQIHDSGVTESGHCYYVMDYISGRTLDAHIQQYAPALNDRLRLFHRVCDAVNAAHLRGVIHRDLKPSNIRVTAGGDPVLVDFGLARIAIPDFTDDETPQPMTITGQFVGSLPWASPEQAEGSGTGIDLRTDVYSLGVILYRLLTGRFPYKVIGSMREVMDNIVRAEPERPSTVSRDIDDEVETIVLKALCKDPDRRYQSAGELARDLDRYFKGEPISAKSDSGWYVMRKTLRRYRVQAAVAFAFVALLAAGAAVSTFLLLRTRDAEHALETQLAHTREARDQAERTRDAGLDLVGSL